jgi:hypothetical protein
MLFIIGAILGIVFYMSYNVGMIRKDIEKIIKENRE